MNTFYEAIYWTALASIRPIVACYLIPFIGNDSGGNFIRIPYAIAIAILVHPLGAELPDTLPPLFLIVCRELLLGIGIGFLVRRLFIVVGTVGALIDQQTGYTIGSMFDPNLEQESGPLESLLTNLTGMLLLGGGGAFLFASGLLESFRVWPLLSVAPDMQGWSERLRTSLFLQIGDLEEIVLNLAMPFLGVLLFSEICVGILGRYAQQLNPFSIVLAVKALVLALLLFTMHGVLIDGIEDIKKMLLRIPT